MDFTGPVQNLDESVYVSNRIYKKILNPTHLLNNYGGSIRIY